MEGEVNMETFLANVRYAIRNKQSAEIGGGIFTWKELEEIVIQIESLIERAKDTV